MMSIDQMDSSSFEKESANIGSSSGAIQDNIKSSNSTDNTSLDQSFRNATNRSSSSRVVVVQSPPPSQHNSPSMLSPLTKRETSLSSTDSADVWGESKLIDDPVGDIITQMLNDGRVPEFGYVPRHDDDISQRVIADGFQLYPLISSRNYRALKSYISRLLNKDKTTTSLNNTRNVETHPMRFLLESFAVTFIVVYSLNDIILRSVSEFIKFSVIGTISTLLFDMEELRYVINLLLPSFLIGFYNKLSIVAWKVIAIIETDFLWGYYTKGRTLLFTAGDADSKRLLSFRRKHQQIYSITKERRRNKKDRRESKAERRRRKRRGESFTESEVQQMEAEIDTKRKLAATSKELSLNPPTFFPDKVHKLIKNDPDASLRHNTTSRHLESLEFCQQMIFTGLDQQKQKDAEQLKHQVSIRTGRASEISRENSALSPREEIEIVDHKFPDIGEDQFSSNNTRDRTLSLDSLSDDVSYDENSSSDEDSSDDEEGDFDDTTSMKSHTSDSTAQSLAWIDVGAKIGHKLLNARKLRRVIANPDAAQQLIPEEAKKLIDGISNDISFENSHSSSPSKQDESDEVDGQDVSISQSLNESPEKIPKRPVHGMWTKAGSVRMAPNSFGAVTLSAPSSPRNPSFTLETRVESPTYTYSDNNTPAVRRLSNGLAPPLPSPAIEVQVSPLIKSMPNSPEDTPQHANGLKPLLNGTEGPPPAIPVTRLAPIEKGVKIVLPMMTPNSQTNAAITSGSCFYQMGTVMSSQRIYVSPNGHETETRRKRNTNCLSIKVILDKALLRGSKFAEMNIRIMDEWNYVPRHSKYAIGSCVATTFGVGVLVGWRVEDDMHIIRSLWNRRGPGSGIAYLRRDSLHSVVEAAVGFDVQTTYGPGTVTAYTKGGNDNTAGKYSVHLNGRHKDRVVEFNRCQILSCNGATFVPVTEHIRAAALYRLEVLNYKAKLREHMLNGPSKGIRHKGMWRNFSEYVDLFVNSFSKAIAEDPDFDSEVDKFISYVIHLLDGKKEDKKDFDDTASVGSSVTNDTGICQSEPPISPTVDDSALTEVEVKWDPWKDIIGCFFIEQKKEEESVPEDNDVLIQAQAFDEAHQSAEVLIRVLLKTLTVAKASVPDRPKLHIALAMIQESLLLFRQVLRVQQAHTSRNLLKAWFRALNEISETFGPLKQRLEVLGIQISKKFKKHGSIAKQRILRFVDIVLGDTRLLHALELGDWKSALSRFEHAVVKSGITDDQTVSQLHRGGIMMYKSLAPRKKDRKTDAAATRNTQKAINFAKVMKIVASPGRSFVRLLTNDEVLVLFDRILVRVFEKDPLCSMMINIYAFNFESIRHLRTLNNMSIAGKLWETVLDACDEEMTFATSEIPEQTKVLIEPFVKLFSLGVAQFHCIQSGGSNADWLDFLMEDDAVKIIQELDFKLISFLEGFCCDIKQVVQVLPYIKTIDNDILSLMDEFDFDIFLKEITDVIGDKDKSMAYFTERSVILVERFLDYLPRMNFPIERVPLQDGWVLTCRSKDGGDLRLSDLSVLRENLSLSVLGSDNVFLPLNGQDNYIGSPTLVNNGSADSTDNEEEEESIIDEVRELIQSAQSHGAWIAGVGGLKESSQFNGVPSQLNGVPLSDKLKSQIDLWQSSAIDDFDLLETTIREVSQQIQLQKEREENGIPITEQSSSTPTAKQFDPKVDPTILSLDITNLTLRLEEFGFRVEKGEPLTIFDPVFEGRGSINVKNVSISLKVEVKKERMFRDGVETGRPVLQLANFDIKLEQLKLVFMETGADWILNGVLKGFRHQITEIVEANLKEQIMAQVHTLLDQVNTYLDTNPDFLLNSLEIGVDDLDESIVSV